MELGFLFCFLLNLPTLILILLSSGGPGSGENLCGLGCRKVGSSLSSSMYPAWGFRGVFVLLSDFVVHLHSGGLNHVVSQDVTVSSDIREAFSVFKL